MHPSDQKPLKALNRLLQVNNQRLEGYALASQNTDISVLQVLFERLTETSLQCREELCREVYKLGGKPIEFKAGGDFEKAWETIREALQSDDHVALLNSCYMEEFMSFKSYEYALRYFRQDMNSGQISLFSRQMQMLREDQTKVANLRQVLLKAA